MTTVQGPDPAGPTARSDRKTEPADQPPPGYASLELDNNDFDRSDPRLMHRVNMRAVFEFFLHHHESTRRDVCARTGLSPATASKAVKNLVEQGLLEPVSTAVQSGMGRPSTTFRPAQDRSYVLGISVAVDKCSVVAAGLHGQALPDGVTVIRTPKTYKSLVQSIARAAKRLMANRPGRPLCAGIGAPGLVDRQRGVVLMSPNLHPLDGQPLRQDLQKHLGLATVMFHETTGTCLAARMNGAARGLNDFVMIGIYEGFGASIVSHGELLAGRDDMAGELGHFTVIPDGAPCGCGNRGCLETVATDRAFAAAVSRRLGQPMTIEQIIRETRAGQMDVTQELLGTLSYLAIGIAGIINITNPEAVLVCSKLFEVDDRALGYLESMVHRRALRSLSSHCRIIQAVGDVGQGAVAGTIHNLVTAIAPKLATTPATPNDE